jgi:hypothetical protein
MQDPSSKKDTTVPGSREIKDSGHQQRSTDSKSKNKLRIENNQTLEIRICRAEQCLTSEVFPNDWQIISEFGFRPSDFRFRNYLKSMT